MKKEFIGLDLEVTNSNNKSLIGIKGTIIDETKNTFVLNNEKTIMKQNNQFNIDNQTIDGNEINMRPEDRIKQ